MFGVHIVPTSRQHAQDAFCFTFDNLLHPAAVSHVHALEGNKLNMLIHRYSHKHEEDQVAICNHQACSLLCLWPEVWSGLCMERMFLNIIHSKLPCNYCCYTHPLICLLCCSVKNDVVIASRTDVFDELYGDTTEDSCELWGYVLMLEYMLQCFGMVMVMVMSFGQAANIVLPEAVCTKAKFNHSAFTIVSIDIMLSSSYQYVSMFNHVPTQSPVPFTRLT